MISKKMPEVQKPVKMDAALDVLFGASAHSTAPDEHHGWAEIYLDEHRSISYKSRWNLKTHNGALERQKRETIQFLTDLRAQIDDVLSKIETVSAVDGMICVESFVYTPREREKGDG